MQSSHAMIESARSTSNCAPNGCALLLFLVLLGACGEETPLDRVVIPEGFPKADCDALDPSHCVLPWPSNLYLARDEATPSGSALRFGATSLPRNSSRTPLDPALFDGLDGYGLGTPIVVGFGDLDLGNLPSEWDGLALSITPESPSLLLEVDGDALVPVPHFVERDGRGSPGSAVSYLRPAEILKPATRYIVAFRDLYDVSGEPLAPSEAFAALRDRESSADAGVAWRREGFEEIFERLEGFGVDRGELVLAWDFWVS